MIWKRHICLHQHRVKILFYNYFIHARKLRQRAWCDGCGECFNMNHSLHPLNTRWTWNGSSANLGVKVLCSKPKGRPRKGKQVGKGLEKQFECRTDICRKDSTILEAVPVRHAGDFSDEDDLLATNLHALDIEF